MSNFTSVEIVLNGRRQAVPEGQTVIQLLQSLGVEPSRVAVELNRKILPKSDWSTTPLSGGDEVEVVHFVGGG